MLPKNTTKKVFTAINHRPEARVSFVHKRASTNASASASTTASASASSPAPMIFAASDREKPTVKKSVAKKNMLIHYN